jgi:hypothetical protein
MQDASTHLRPYRQRWPAPSAPRPIVLIGAGGIVRDAHLPAYRAAGLPLQGVYDTDRARAEALAREFGIPRVYRSRDEAMAEWCYVAGSASHIVTGIRDAMVLLIGLAEVMENGQVDHVKFGIKIAVTAVILLLAWPRRKDVSIASNTYHAIGVLALLNVAVAVFVDTLSK